MMHATRTPALLALTAVVALPAAALLSGCQTTGTKSAAKGPQREPPRPLPDPVRAIWVARFHYHSPADIREIMANCRAAGANTVLWQVRGAGTVTYPSRIEPWSPEYTHRDPGFDPLAIAVAEAHRAGLRIEAWFNVLTGWRGSEPPPVPGQLYNAHPQWFLQDAQGRRQPLVRTDPTTGERTTFYVALNPCCPEVRAHIVSLIDEIVSHYDVDGIHLDYVRYVWDGLENGKQRYARDPRTLALYWRDTGRAPDDSSRSWDAWRANRLTDLVGEIRAAVNRRRPGASLTAAVWRNPQRAYYEFLQNSTAWLRAGLVDAVMPMAYTAELAQLDADIRAYHRLAPGCRVVPGLGIYLLTQPDQVRSQICRCLEWGGDVALFSYESLFRPGTEPAPRSGPASQAQQRQQHRRAMRLEVLRQTW